MTIDTKQMDAVVIEASGPPAQSLAYRREPVPEPGPGEVLVEVHAAAVNPLDVVNAAGWLGTPLPVIPGGDYAGTVVSDGDHAGQQVWGSGPALGMAMGTKRQGTHARFVALPETWLSRKPEQLTMAEAAAVGRSYFVAWQTVINIMQLMPGETILITGGAGMVGQAAAAIARWRGAEPIIAGRTHKPNGAGHFIDTTSTDMREAVLELTGGQSADLALDTVGGALFQPALRSLRFGGRLTGIFSAPEPQADFSVAEIYNRQLHVTGLASVFMDGADVARIFDQLRPLFDRGYLAPPPVQTWPLKDSAGAYQTVLDGSAGIKQVLLPTLLSPADSAGQGVAQQRLPGRPAAVDPGCLAAAAPAGAHVVKAFNTLFGHVLAARKAGDRPLDVFIAGDDAGAKARVAAFAESLALRPLDVGGLAMARWLEGAGLLEMRLAIGGAVKDGNFSLAVNVLG